MSWGDFWKTKDEKDELEFLTNPHEAYKKIQTKFQEMDGEIQANEITIKKMKDAHNEIVIGRDHTILDLQQNVRHKEADLSRAERVGLRNAEKYENKKTKLLNEYKTLEAELINKLEADYKTRWKQKEAALEKDYNHEVHEFIEKQQEKQNELLPLIIRETIIGFHNERANGQS